VLAALLHAGSMPPLAVSACGFLFVVPLLWAVRQRGGRGALPFFFFFFFTGLLEWYWIPRVMVVYGGASPPLGGIALVALAGVLALFGALLGWLVGRAMTGSRHFTLLLPTLWVAHDLLVERALSGFPWCLTGYSQAGNPWFRQWAELGGVHLLTFLVVAAGTLLFRALDTPRRGHILARCALLLLVTHGLGGALWFRFVRSDRAIPCHRAGIVQPNSSPHRTFTWPELARETRGLLATSQALAARGAEFVVWPESSVPLLPRQSPIQAAWLQEFARDHVPLLAGFTDIEGEGRIYNALMSFDGQTIGRYAKVHLTPFGEYIPFRRLLFFVKKITDQVGDFNPGPPAPPLTVNGHRLATPICYEVIFPALVRDQLAAGGELIVTVSNDGWFGDTSAPRQHLAMAAIRAVEGRRDLLRSTSTGISARVDALGSVSDPIPYDTAGARLVSFRYRTNRTVFLRGGYLFPWGCALLAVLWFLADAVSRRRKPAPVDKPAR